MDGAQRGPRAGMRFAQRTGVSVLPVSLLNTLRSLERWCIPRESSRKGGWQDQKALWKETEPSRLTCCTKLAQISILRISGRQGHRAGDKDGTVRMRRESSPPEKKIEKELSAYESQGVFCFRSPKVKRHSAAI